MKKIIYKKKIRIFIEILISVIIIFFIFISRYILEEGLNTHSYFKKIEYTKENSVVQDDNQEYEKKSNSEVEMSEKIDNILKEYEKDNNKIGIVYYDLKNNYRYSNNSDEYFSMASTTKVIYAMYVYDRVYKGQVSEDEEIPYYPSYLEDGNGEITNNKKKKSYKLDYVIKNMLTYSDNTATNMILGNKNNTTQLLKSFFRNNFSIEIKENMLKENKLTPSQMESVFKYLYEHKDKYEKIIEYLKDSKYNEWIKNGIHNKTIASKYGQILGVANDSAIVFDDNNGDYILLIYTYNLNNQEKVIADISNKIDKLHDENSKN